MTCIVGVSDGQRVLLGGDSAGVSFEDQEVYSLRTAKVFATGAYVIGYTTSFRLGQILRYTADLPQPPLNDLVRFMSTAWVEAVRQSLSREGFEDSLSPRGSLLVGVRGRLFGIGKDFHVIEGRTPYAAVGCGRLIAYGALFATEEVHLDLEQRAECALLAAQQYSPGVRGPFSYVQSRIDCSQS